MKHFTLESASLHSIYGKNVLNSQTLYFSILSYRPFFSAFKGPLSEDGLSLEPCVPFTVISIAFIHSYIFYTFHPTLSLHRYGAHGIFSHP